MNVKQKEMEVSMVVNYFMHHWLVILLLLGAGTGNAIMDTIQFHFSTSILADKGSWWNNKLSWINKWKLDAEGNPIVGTNRYFLSSTALVFTTDAWHFFQFVMLTLFTVAILVHTPFSLEWYVWIIDFIVFKLTFSIAFMLNWKWILVKK